jgi:hypothetical protein
VSVHTCKCEKKIGNFEFHTERKKEEIGNFEILGKYYSCYTVDEGSDGSCYCGVCREVTQFTVE